MYSLKGSEAWEIRWADECRCGKESQITDQPKNAEEKEFRRASPFFKKINNLLHGAQE